MELNPLSHEFQEDPLPIYRWLRDEAPCYFNPQLDFYALSRYADVIAASQQPVLYSSAKGTSLEPLDTDAMPPMILFMDPPAHDVQRALVGRAFTPRSISDLEPFVRSTVRALLGPLRERGHGDAVIDFAGIFPSFVIMELLGVPEGDREQLRRWIEVGLVRAEEPPYISDESMSALAELTMYWVQLVPEKRAHPDGGLISRLCEAEVPGPDGQPTHLTDWEVVGFCSVIGAAGTETLTKLFASSLVLFHRNRDQWEAVVADRGLVAGAVEETLRYWPPSQYQGRVLTDDVTVHGVTMPKGARVLLLTGAANHDEREYDDPTRFDVRRPPHVAAGFGHGLHFCLGAALARLEARVAIEEWMDAFPGWEIDEANARRVHQSNVHGYASVPFTA